MRTILFFIIASLSLAFSKETEAQNFPPAKYPSEIRVLTSRGVANYWNVNRVLCLGKATQSNNGGYKFKIVGKAIRTSPSRSIDIYYILPGDKLQSAGSFVFPAIEAGKPFNFDIVAAYQGYSPAKFKGFYIKDETLPDEIMELPTDNMNSKIIAEDEPIIPIEKEKKPTAEDDDEIYKQVETEPNFPGGVSGIFAHIARNMKYPTISAENGVQGRVVIGFVIEKNGSISNVKVIKGVDRDLDREAVRDINTLPKFTPGKINGKPVRTLMNLPVTFKLN